MSHLPTERLAALVDEAPTATELAHLSSCAECARERAAHRNLAEFAASSAVHIGAPLTSWESLSPILVADGVIDRGRGSPFRAHSVRRPWLQAAAGVLLVAGGMMAGRRTVGAPMLPIHAPSRRCHCRRQADSTPNFASSRRRARRTSAVAGGVSNGDGVSRAERHGWSRDPTVRRPCARASPRSIARAT